MPDSRTDDNFLRSKYTSPASFLLAVLLFLLPFVEIKCENATIAQNTGLGLAIGSEFKPGKELQSYSNSLQDAFGVDKNAATTTKKSSKSKMYVVALAALILGVIGIFAAYSSRRSAVPGMALGIAAAVCLVILMIQINSDAKPSAAAERDGLDNVRISVSFTMWYYISLLSFLAAAFFSYQRHQGGSPPRGVPQVPIDNPGDQSEFPKSPTESEIG